MTALLEEKEGIYTDDLFASDDVLDADADEDAGLDVEEPEELDDDLDDEDLFDDGITPDEYEA